MANKKELIGLMVGVSKLNKVDAAEAIKAFEIVVTKILSQGGRVQITGFGSFEAVTRPARMARNPKTGEQASVMASRAVKFKIGKALKEAIN